MEAQRTLQEWHLRLAAAEAKRNEALERIRIRAAATTSRCAHVVRAAKKKQEVEAHARLSRLVRRLERAAESRAARLHAHRDRRHKRALSSTHHTPDANRDSEEKVEALTNQYSTACHAAARAVQTHWRLLLRHGKTTAALADGFQSIGLTSTVHAMQAVGSIGLLSPDNQSSESFDRVAQMLSSTRTIKATASLLGRIECLLQVLIHRDSKSHHSKQKHEHKHKQIQKHKLTHDHHKVGDKHSAKYQVRPFLSAYMILSHPHVVLNAASRKGGFGLLKKETALWTASKALISSFHALNASFLAKKESNRPVRVLLTDFERSWVHYIHQFTVWKGRDALALESQLIQTALELEMSRQSKLASRRPSTDMRASDEDMRALSEGVDRDLDLIGNRLFRLAGKKGTNRLKAALKAVNADEVMQAVPCSTSTCSSTESVHRSIGSNVALAWQLFYDTSWRLSSEALETEWKLILATPFEKGASTGRSGYNGGNRSISLQPLSDALSGVVSLLPLSDSASNIMGNRDRVAELEEKVKTTSLDLEDLKGCINEGIALVNEAFCLALALGSPARDDPAQNAYRALQHELSRPSDDQSKDQCILNKAIRLVSLQWRLLRVDLANAYLTSFVTKSIETFEDVYEYVRTKLDLSLTNVPRTHAWMALSSARAALIPTTDASTTTTTGREGAFQCPKLRAGLANACAQDLPVFKSDTKVTANPPVEHWQRVLRVGLVLWVAGQGPIPKIGLPETLTLDAARLHSAKVEFQRTLVLGILLDLNRNLDENRYNDAMEARKASKIADKLDIKRLRAILASPDVGVDDIVTELVNQKRMTDQSPKEKEEQSKSDKEEEHEVREAFKSMLSPHSTVMQDWTEYLADELIRHVNCLPESSADQCQHHLDLTADMDTIVSIILKVAYVQERVWGDLYRKLHAEGSV